MWISRLFCTGKPETTKPETTKPEHPAIIRARELAKANRERNADTIDQKRIVRSYWNNKE